MGGSVGGTLILQGAGTIGTPSSANALGVVTTLVPPVAGVKVTVNGVAAPLLYVSATQINLLLPYATPAYSYATFQVVNNGLSSNQVTVYTSATAPGVYTSTQNGIGPAAVLHADYSVVTQSNPAKAGETLSVYVTGLGSVTPTVADGAAAPSSPLSTVDDSNLLVELSDSSGNVVDPSIVFAGLAPGLAGLYQINFTMPSSGVASGGAYLNIGTTDAYTTEAKLYVK